MTDVRHLTPDEQNRIARLCRSGYRFNPMPSASPANGAWECDVWKPRDSIPCPSARVYGDSWPDVLRSAVSWCVEDVRSHREKAKAALEAVEGP